MKKRYIVGHFTSWPGQVYTIWNYGSSYPITYVEVVNSEGHVVKKLSLFPSSRLYLDDKEEFQTAHPDFQRAEHWISVPFEYRPEKDHAFVDTVLFKFHRRGIEMTYRPKPAQQPEVSELLAATG